MQIFQYFVHYSFEDIESVRSAFGLEKRIHDQVIVSLKRPVRTTRDLQGELKQELSHYGRERYRHPDFPQARDIRIESASPWGSYHTKAYDKWRAMEDAERDRAEHDGVPWWRRPKRTLPSAPETPE